MSLPDIVPVLQLAVVPVILISGVGLILLSMTNRYGRVIDRSRMLTHELRDASTEERTRLLGQLRILWRRARLARAGISCGVMSVLLAALLVISLFAGVLLDLHLAPVVVGLFAVGMLSLIAALLFFIAEVNLSLRALWFEIPPEGRSSPDPE